MKFGLTVYGTTYSMGIHPRSERTPITPRELMDEAELSGLAGIEYPLHLLRKFNPEETADYAGKKGMFLTVAGDGFDPDSLKEALILASRAGAGTLRTVVGGAKFGGDRRHMAGMWKPFMARVLDGFKKAAETAEAVGVNLAVENHQDLASEELLWLCESIGSPRFGITLDTGNPLATAEEPSDYFRRVAPFVKNVHLKDYCIYPTEEGYLLVRCPLGKGVIDFPGLFDLLAVTNPDVTLSLEHGALEARHVRMLADDFWPEYPDRSAAQLSRLMRFIHDHAMPRGDWRTPYEKNEPADAIAAYEQAQQEFGLAYLSIVMRRYRTTATNNDLAG